MNVITTNMAVILYIWIWCATFVEILRPSLFKFGSPNTPISLVTHIPINPYSLEILISRLRSQVKGFRNP